MSFKFPSMFKCVADAWSFRLIDDPDDIWDVDETILEKMQAPYSKSEEGKTVVETGKEEATPLEKYKKMIHK